uniref:Progonadoliberin-1 n=1 Tax=Latimeria chalumnae TaxID=7897 RepID=H3BBD7_LATCH
FPSRMGVTKKLCLLLSFILAVDLCSSQYWSYDLRPGGKRNSEHLMESFQDITNNAERPVEPEQSECSHPQQSRINLLKGALANLIEGEAGKKKM